jgi:3-hydroxyisobutyrate dehydrogenase-like beta-hydroxyacid dehydrogenase
MGGGMARRLLSRGFDVLAWNRSPARLDAVVARGASPAAGIDQVMAESDILLVSLRSSEVLVEVADRDLVPAARRGQIVADTGTTEVAETRRLAAAFARKGAAWIDAPVSGGEAGAEGGELRVFIGGDPGAADRLTEVFAALSAPGKAVYCGPSGAGQMMKYVNQMAMGLVEAAYIETIAFGVRGGLRPEDMLRVLDGDETWRRLFAARIKRVAAGEGEQLLVKQPELAYFVRAADDMRFTAPLLRSLESYLADAPKSWTDNMNRPRPSFWHELTTRNG